MDEAMQQAYARLGIHEFALEVMMANWLAAMPEDQTARFLDDFGRRLRTGWTAFQPDDAESDALDQAFQASIAYGDNFIDKVRRRIGDIRGQWARDGASPDAAPAHCGKSGFNGLIHAQNFMYIGHGIE